MTQRQEAHVAFVLACNASHEALRRITRNGAAPSARWNACRDAPFDAGLFTQRERLLITASPAVVSAAETTHRRLLAIRDLIGSGVQLESDAYEEPYRHYTSALWQLRQGMRADTTVPLLDLADPTLIREQLPQPDEGQQPSV
ncbi:hypothetical protein ACWGLF_44910 [Streptomyces puniciscabiei]